MMDPIADMINRLKNAAAVGKELVVLPYSNAKHAIAEKLVKRGMAKEVSVHGKKAAQKTLEITLARTTGGAFRFSDVRRVSRPGCRVYVGARDIKPVRGGMGSVLLSTPRGVLFGDEARKESVGGEVLFEIW